MRESRKPLVFSNFSGGIDQRDMEAAPNTVRDARNVWWRNGRLEGRPGFVGYPNPMPTGRFERYTKFNSIYYASAASVSALDATVPTALSPVDDAANTAVALNTLFTSTHHALYFAVEQTYPLHSLLGIQSKCEITGINLTSTELVAVEFWVGTHWESVPFRVTTDSYDSMQIARGARTRGWGNSSAVSGLQDGTWVLFYAPLNWDTSLVLGEFIPGVPYALCRFRFEGAPHATHKLYKRSLDTPFAAMSENDGDERTSSKRSCLSVVGPEQVMLSTMKTSQQDALADDPVISNAIATPCFRQSQWPGHIERISTYDTELDLHYVGSEKAVLGESYLEGVEARTHLSAPRVPPPLVAYSPLLRRYWLRHKGEWYTNANIPQPGTVVVYTVYDREDVLAQPASDPDLVGAGAPYDSTVIAQLTEWPDTPILYYHDAQLFACGLKDSPQMVRWSAPDFDGALDVWPEVNFVLLTDNQDSSDITGAATLNEHLYVFKRNSIWMLVPNGATDEGLAIYSARKVVSGVGSVNHHSIAAGNGRLYFLSESGVCEFDGINVKQLTQDKFQDSTLNITPENESMAAGVWWATEGCYLLSVAVGSIDYNNLTVCYQPDRDALWLWDGITPQIWAKVVTSERGEVLYYNDWLGRVCEFGHVKHDHHGAVDSWVQTHKLGLGDGRRYTVRDVRLTAANSAQSYEVTIQADDDDSESASLAVNMDAASNRKWALAAPSPARYWNTLVYDKVRTLDRRVDLRQSARQFSVKVRTSSVGQEFQLQSLALGVKAEGKR